MKPIKQICDEFLSSGELKYTRFSPSMQRQLLDAFLQQYKCLSNSIEYLPDAIRNVVKSYSRGKDNAIRFFQTFIKYLNKYEHLDVSIDPPPIPISNAFERAMYIAKAIQDPSGKSPYKTDELSDQLWTSKETIEDDIKKLRGLTEDSISFMDQKLIVQDLSRGKGEISYNSTVHPVFIAGNLTQILILLRGLREMCKNQLFSSYGLPLAASIWSQLSDYAQKRIVTVSEEILHDQESSWFHSLDSTKDGRLYRNEETCSLGQRPMAILMCAKNHKPCDIEYFSPGGEMIQYLNVLIKDSRHNNTWTIVDNDEEIVLLESGITKVTVSQQK